MGLVLGILAIIVTLGLVLLVIAATMMMPDGHAPQGTGTQIFLILVLGSLISGGLIYTHYVPVALHW